MASVKDIIEAGKDYQTKDAASNPTITTKPPRLFFDETADKLESDMGSKPFQHVITYLRARYPFGDGKFPPQGIARIQTSDGGLATERWELWRITIPPETDSVSFITKIGYSIELAITERGIVAYRKERPYWMLGNRYDSWVELDVDRLNEHLEHIQFVQEAALEYNLSLVDGEDHITEAEMAEIMESKGIVNHKAERKCSGCCHYMGEYIKDLGLQMVELPPMGKYLALDACYLCGRQVSTLEKRVKFSENGILVKTAHSKCYDKIRLGAADLERKYTDADMMLKDDEIARLKQRVDTLEKMLIQVHSQYGVDWQQIRGCCGGDEVKVIQEPRKPERFDAVCSDE